MKRLKVDTLAYGPVSVWYDAKLCEYQVRYAGNKAATYFTTDKADALATAQRMRNHNGYINERTITHSR